MNKFYSGKKEVSFLLLTKNGQQRTVAAGIPKSSSLFLRVFILVLASFLFSVASHGQNATATWALTASGTPAVSGNVTATTLSSGNNSFGNGTAVGSYASTGLSMTKMNTYSSSSPSTPDASDYIEFKVSPATGYSLTISSITTNNNVSTTISPNNAKLAIQYSLNSSFASPTTIVSASTLTTSSASFGNSALNISISSGQSLYVRIFAWGLSASGTALYTKNVQIVGNACPSTAAISYTKYTYCKDANTTATPTLSGAAGGTYTATPTGLSINSSTGVIDVTNSTAGTYTVTYTVGGTGCSNVVANAPQSITINDLPTAFTFTGPDGATSQFCSNGGSATFTLSGSQTGVTYTFTSINPGGNTPPGQSFSVAGIGGTMNFTKTPDGNWSYEVIAKNNTTGCSNTMNGVVKAIDGATISSQPDATKAVCSGSTVALTLNLSNATSLTWQMSADGGSSWTTVSGSSPYAITKANNNSTTTLTISNVTTAMNGNIYRVAVGSASPCSTTYSTGTTLSVSAIPVITTQPASKTVCSNSTLSLSVVASYASSYQWYKNGALITGATSASYTTTFDASTGAGAYYVMITGTCGSMRSNDANITANSNPGFTTWQGPTTGSLASTATAWETSANWSCGVPTKTIDAVIPANIIDGYPTLKSGLTGEVKNLSIVGGSFGAYLTVEGKLQVYGTVTNSGGTFTASNGTIELAGSTTQTIPAGLFDNNTVQNLIISNNVSLGGTLNLTGTLSFGAVNNKTFATNDYLTLKSSSAATAKVSDITNNSVNSGNSISGKVTVERFVPAWEARKYRLVTAPVLGTTINASWQEGQTFDGSGQHSTGTTAAATTPSGYGTLITGQQQGAVANANGKGFDFWSAISNSSASIRYYIPTSAGTGGTWQPLSSTVSASAFDQNQAYLLFVRGDRSVSTGTTPGATTLRAKGELKQGSYAVNVPEAMAYTLIGNPYASPLDFQAVYNANSTSIQDYFWVWQSSYGAGTGGYLLVQPSGDGSSYECIPGNFSTSSSYRLIGSGQGFFVVPKNQNNASTTVKTITISETHKSSSTPGVSVFRQTGGAPAKLYINLTTTNNSGQSVILDGGLVKFNEAFTGTSGNVLKSTNNSENLSFWKGNADLIVSAASLPKAGDTVQLKLWNTAVRSYRFEIKTVNFATPGLTAVLLDDFAKTETPLSLKEGVAAFGFSITSDAASKDPLRFRIVFKGGSTLPLQLSRASASEKGSGVQVEWHLADESGVKHYVVEKSANGTDFTLLAETGAKAVAGPADYAAFDKAPFSTNYYRIKLIGINGETKYSSVMKVQLQKGAETVSVFPNPLDAGVINLQMTSKAEGRYQITLFNVAGQQVWGQILRHAGGSATVSLPIRMNLAAGLYTLSVKSANGATENIRVQVAQ